jgi:hypothetical protein
MKTMSEVNAANAVPAGPAAASTQAGSAPVQSVTNEPKTVTLTEAEYNRLNGAVQRANRIADELNSKLEKLQSNAPIVQEPPKPPAGVEERLNKLASELESERNARAEEKLQIKIMEAASKHGVSPDRVDYLDYKLRKANRGLTADGVQDGSNPNARISVDTLVASLLSTNEGAVFKSAPNVASLPVAGQSAGANIGKKTMKLSEFNEIAKRGGEAYKQVHASVKAKETILVDD